MTDGVDRDRWREVEAIFDRAIELDPADRPAYLEDACAGDADLRIEVESLLDAHASAADYLETTVASMYPALTAGYRPGQRIGPYRLVKEIGRGGLGLVFLAVDTRLDRHTALKFLPVLRASDPEARARFRREARTASSLDHPNICTVYEIGETDAGDPFISMAYVEGETLKDRIARGPLPLADAIDFAVDIANGLAHAHKNGIVHRDIKPANLIVTTEGDVKIVDFGLARHREATRLTREGATPGTVAYMSPEQIQGQEVDGRTDIWALGVVLYETITGRLPFLGESEQSRIWSILNRDPEPLTALRAGVPLALEPVIAKALAKDPSSRYQHAEELPVDLRAALEPAARPIPFIGRSGQRAPGRRAALVGLASLAVGVVLGGLIPRLIAPEPAPLVHLTAMLPAGQLLSEGSRRIAISPDGARFVYTARSGGRDQLWVRSLDSQESTAIPGTDNARDPFFSPDGRSVGYFADRSLFKVSLDGGGPQKIADAPSETNRGASWGADGTIVLPLGLWSGLFRVADSGGDLEPLTVPVESRSAHMFPQIVRDGRSVLYTVWSGVGWKTAMLDMASGESIDIADGCGAARYVESGHLVCAEMEGLAPTGSFLAATFDPARPELRGSFVSVPRPAGLGTFDFASSRNGTLVFAGSPPLGERATLAAVDRDGRATTIANDVEYYRTPAVSPDGKRIAVTRIVEAGRHELWLYGVGSSTPSRLSTTGAVNNMPVWSPDGQRVVFNSVRPNPGLYSVAPESGAEATLLLAREKNIIVPASFSPDGTLLAVTEIDNRTLGNLWVLSLHDSSRTVILNTPANERSPMFSPGGDWIAYASDESGRDEIYVRPWPGPGAPVQVSTDGGREPAWSRDGDELFYRRGDSMIAVAVRTTPVFSADRPATLFDGPFATEYVGARHYDVFPDGRFLMVQFEPEPDPVRIEVVLNWFDELVRIVPRGK